MAFPAGSAPDAAATVPPPQDPRAIRACLGPSLAADFDREWETVLDQAKTTKDLAGVFDLLAKWQHTAYQEMCAPGSYNRMLNKADQIIYAGHNPDAVPAEDLRSLIRRRLGR